MTHLQIVRQKASSLEAVAIPYTGPDRLSELPDTLRVKILSSLPAREVAQTCVLSKQWRKLWASVPCLDFDSEEFFSQFSEESQQRFIKFVTSFLLLIDEATDLDTFHLSYSGGDDFNFADGTGISYAACMWITLAVKHKIKKLLIDLLNFNRLRVPDSLFVSASLEELFLRLFTYNTVELKPELVFLPKLKSLHLCFISISGDNMKKILNGCPAVENLSVEGCEIATIDVFLGNLKRLRVSDAPYICLDIIPRMFPRLEYLDLEGVTIDHISFNKMPKVTEASISCDIEEKLKCDVLGSLVNVEVLEFRSNYLMDVLEKALQNSPIFDKLRRLSLGNCCMICAFGLLSSLLEHTRKLETLTLFDDGWKCRAVNEDHGQNSREMVEWVHCKCLKKVEIFSTIPIHVPQLLERVKLSTMGLNKVSIIVSNR